MAEAQGQPLTVSVMSSYGILGPASLDTAAALRAFAAGLSADSSVRIVPPPFVAGMSPEQRRAAIATRPAVQFGATVSFAGTAKRSHVEIRAIDIASTSVVFRASLDVDTTQDLTVALDSLGRKFAQELVRHGALRVRRDTTWFQEGRRSRRDWVNDAFSVSTQRSKISTQNM